MNIEIIDAKERNIFLHLTADAYPVFFTQAYHEFEHSNGYETGFITEDHKVWMPFRIYKKLIFNFIQIMYPPLLAGERLTVAAEKKFLNACIEQLKKEKNIIASFSRLCGMYFILFPIVLPIAHLANFTQHSAIKQKKKYSINSHQNTGTLFAKCF